MNTCAVGLLPSGTLLDDGWCDFLFPLTDYQTLLPVRALGGAVLTETSAPGPSLHTTRGRWGRGGGTPMLHNLMYKRNDSIQNTYTKYDLSKWYHHVPYVLWWVLMEIHIIISYTVQYKIAHPFWAWRNWLVEWEGSGGSSSRRWTQPTSHQRWHFVHWYLHVQC